MILISQTSVAPATGVAGASAPKAGGVSAFALALGNLRQGDIEGDAEAMPALGRRQTLAEGGKGLPEFAEEIAGVPVIAVPVPAFVDVPYDGKVPSESGYDGEAGLAGSTPEEGRSHPAETGAVIGEARPVAATLLAEIEPVRLAADPSIPATDPMEASPGARAVTPDASVRLTEKADAEVVASRIVRPEQAGVSASASMEVRGATAPVSIADTAISLSLLHSQSGSLDAAMSEQGAAPTMVRLPDMLARAQITEARAPAAPPAPVAAASPALAGSPLAVLPETGVESVRHSAPAPAGASVVASGAPAITASFRIDAAAGTVTPAPVSARIIDPAVVTPEPGTKPRPALSDAPVVTGRTRFEAVGTTAARRVVIAPPTTVSASAGDLPVAALVDPIPARALAVQSPVGATPVFDPLGIAAPAPTAAVVPASPAGSVDTRAPGWLDAMIEQIETLRDAGVDGDVQRTRIRLSPDALGAVEIELVQDGDRLDLRIIAETAGARALLSEAAPRLNEMVESRGLKLAHSGVEGGGANERHDRPADQSSERTATNRRAAPGRRDDDRPSDERIA